MNNIKLVLASGSPRRHEILTMAGFAHEVRPTDAAEDTDRTQSPEKVVAALSRLKADAALRLAADGEIILAADTVVAWNGKILEKPRDAEDARRMLENLSGNAHSVFTGVTLASKDKIITHVEETAVRFRPLSAEEIAAYIATGEPMDKAGSYGVQGRAGKFVSRIEGDYWNVVGLPICKVSCLLRDEFGLCTQ